VDSFILHRIEIFLSNGMETMSNSGRDYWAIWKQFVPQGVMLEDVLPPALGQSWRRCVAQGLDPYGASSSEGEDIRGILLLAIFMHAGV
jgi:hypothetical protein